MTKEILEALAALHTDKAGWVFVPEMRTGSGYGGMDEQRLDAWAICCWKVNKIHNLRRAYEIKVSLADLRTELLNPDKRWMAYALSHEFYFVAPVGLISVDALGPDDGLMEWDGTELSITKKAKVRATMPPRWSFVASITRTLCRGY